MTVEEIREAALRLKLSCAYTDITECASGRCAYDSGIGCRMVLQTLDIRAVVDFALDGTQRVLENVKDETDG